MKCLTRHAIQLGMRFEQAAVLDAELDGNYVKTLITSRGIRPVKNLIIAAGAYSHLLSQKFGDQVPLETERGYHVTIKNPNVGINLPIMDSDMKTWITPMEVGIRCAGTVELASLEAPANQRRYLLLIKLLKRMLPELDTKDYTTWMGRRPTLPDSLPVISRSALVSNVFYAFGHQHLGLTGGPMTAQWLIELLQGRVPNQDLAAFRVNRFD